MNIFDLHCDTIYECQMNTLSLYENELAVSVTKLQKFEMAAQVFAIWMPDTLRGDDAINYFSRSYDHFQSELGQHIQCISLCKTAGDLNTKIAAGKVTALLSVEGGSVLAGSLEALDMLYAKGVRMMTLTWNRDNEIGSGSGGNHTGLTKFGRQVIQRMNELVPHQVSN